MTEPAAAPSTGGKVLDDTELRVRDRQEYQLRDAIPRCNGIRRATAVPARDHQRPLVVRVDEADEIAEHDAMFVTQPGTGQDHRTVARIADVDRDAGRNECGGSRLQDQ